MTYEDLSSFHEEFIKDQKYVTVLVGSRDEIDFNALRAYGEINEVGLDELFGYEDTEEISAN